MQRGLVVLLWAGCCCCITVSADDPHVTLDQGALRGKLTTSRVGRNIFTFQGIPFAQPPLGDLKFKPPVEVSPWSGERTAQSPGPACAQINYLTRVYEGQEDCLYLNVYSPRVEGASLPVMVWFHGGGFFSGSGDTSMYGPELMLDQDIVLVTTNYRLGPLGFLSLNSTEAPGNYGLKDQVMALRWVKKNIAKFGGNPDLVTIFGESAGGASVHYLMLAPPARGLFQRAIALSGAANNDWAFQRSPARMARDLATRLGCSVEDSTALLSCVAQVDSRRLEETAKAMMTELHVETIFMPSVEPAGTEDAILTANPRTLLARGDIADVPLMAGLMTLEGIYQLGGLGQSGKSVSEHMQDYHARYVPDELGLSPGSPQFEEVWGKIKDYFAQLAPNNELHQYVLMNTDAEFMYGVDDLVRGVAALKRSPVYYYQFSYDGGLGLIKYLLKITYAGTCHADELGYMFTGPVYPPLQSASPADLQFSERFIKLLTAFAVSGNPTPDSSLGVTWTPVEAPAGNPKLASTRYLDIGAQFVMKNENLNGERVAFWQRLMEENRA